MNSIETVRDLSSILDLVQDARVRSIRWDAIPNALVFDTDCALETKQKDGARVARLCRGWLVIDNAHDLSIHADWVSFRGGFSVVDILESSGLDGRRLYTFSVDFPEGVLTLCGSQMTLLRSKKSVDGDGLELARQARAALASDDEFVSAILSRDP